MFFAPGKPRTRRIFIRDANGAITGFVDRREGIDDGRNEARRRDVLTDLCILRLIGASLA